MKVINLDKLLRIHAETHERYDKLQIIKPSEDDRTTDEEIRTVNLYYTIEFLPRSLLLPAILPTANIYPHLPRHLAPLPSNQETINAIIILESAFQERIIEDYNPNNYPGCLGFLSSFLGSSSIHP